MKKIYYSSVFALVAVLSVSCDSMWKEKISNEWSEDEMWHVSVLAEGVLLNAYYEIPSRLDSYNNNFLDAATDNAVTNSYEEPIYKLAHGGLSVNDNPIGNWDKCYQAFQYINSFLENGLTDNTVYIKEQPELDKQYKERAVGTAHFLRAYWGFQLLKIYGGKTNDGEALGYPLALHFITPEEAERKTDFHRDTYEDCVKQIIADCEVAAQYLPKTYPGNDPLVGGLTAIRVTNTCAYCLQSLVALYGASPAYQPDNIVTLNGGVGDGFTVVNAGEYEKKWQRAVEYSAKAISEAGKYNPLQNVHLADVPNQPSAEILFRGFHNSYTMEQAHFPPRFLGKAHTVPSQNLVDAFPMANGYPIDDARSGYDPNDPYSGRDKRFYLNIYYHGGQFGKADVNADPVYLDISPEGEDSPNSSRYSSLTGYYLAKSISTSPVLLNPINPVSSRHYTPHIRITESWLNYAEAVNEAYGPDVIPPGCTYSAYDVIKMIRQDCGGITDVTYLDEMAASRDSFRMLIQNERRIELAFENHRWFDMRRWLLDLNEPIYGVQVTVDNETGETEYNRVKIEERGYNLVRYYYAPIPYDECIKNPEMKNNLGWM